MMMKAVEAGKLLAFHDDAGIKEKYLARVRAHRAADEIIHGIYWENGKGCAVGCTVHSGSHAAYEGQLGIPRELAKIEDGIFEGMQNGDALTWPERFLEAIPVGADLSGVTDKFLHWLLVDPDDGVIRLASSERSRKAIERVGEMYARKISGEVIDRATWRAYAADAYAYAYAASTSAAASASAASAAADAAAADAYAYAYAASTSAAAAASASAASAAADAADAYAYAYAYAASTSDAASAAARSKARVKQSEKLLLFLRESAVALAA